jgi:hypothetical protein
VSRAKAPLGEKPPSVRLRRSHGGARDPDGLMDAARRGDVLYASPAETPRDKVVVVACTFYDGQRRCEALFEYRGRTAYVSIPYRRHQAWQYGVEAARRNMLGLGDEAALGEESKRGDSRIAFFQKCTPVGITHQRDQAHVTS